ncbi:penicillin-binding protein 1A [Ideonella sp. BN130291]|uniref:penicillin-binding protein 1A n=1 Tax=Ideonella sp. BN130291 TaxID=3112940 RepID=UPI002E252A7D|nr:transglycosylase domain-containing protein [Ideonella sp. BN130291]
MSALPPEPDSPSRPADAWRAWLSSWRGRDALWYVGALLLALLVGGVLYIAALVPLTPGIEDLKQVQTVKPSVLLSADGKTLATFRRTQQEPVKLEQVSPHVVQALLATEDRRFYDHHGLDIRRTFSAMFHTLKGDTQGGSTITQQLARNLFPEDIGRSRNLHRKFKEMVTALRIERVYTKQQILEHYLNSAPFLYNAVGIEMAARTYFDKSAKALDAAEAATLVGMLKGTHYYNPVLFPERAQKRRNLVLQQRVKAGSLTEAQYAQLKDEPLHVTLKRQEEDLGEAPHFAAYARRWLLEWAEAHDVDLYSDGLVIETTLDSRLQKAATQAVERQAKLLQQVADVEWGAAGIPTSTSPEAYAGMGKKTEPFRHFFSKRPDLLMAFLRESPEYKKARQAGATDAAALQSLKANPAVLTRLRQDKTRLEAGFMAMDPTNGEIKAWVGSRDFEHGQFDHVAQAMRQPGSTFKPIVYGAALEAGVGPERAYIDAPVEVRLDARTVWRPTDMHGSTGAMMTLRDGLVYSKNTITAQVSQEVGVPRIVSLARAMGVDQSKLDPVPSIALGTSPVTLLEMVNAYCTIAAQGARHKPVFVRRITGRGGEVLAEFGSETARAMSPDTAVDLIDMMRGVVNQGTGTMVKTRFGLVADIAGKTGTTQNNTDGWFILMHPNLVAGAWVGFDDQRVTMRSDYWGQGGHNAVLLVGDFFRDALKGKLLDAKASFPPPRRPPVVTTYVPPADVEDSYGAIDDVVPGSPAPAVTVGMPVERSTSSAGVVVIGDGPGVEAMRRSSGPPKSAEELDRLFGRGNGASGGAVSTSGTEASQPAPTVEPASSSDGGNPPSN